MATLARRLEDLSSDKQALLTIEIEKQVKMISGQNLDPVDKYLVANIVPARDKAELVNGDNFVKDDKIELWPTQGDYEVYDQLLYRAMSMDHRRNEVYKAAIRQTVADKIVLDVGTGAEALLARYCVEAGARKVYAIEIREDAYRLALAHIKNLRLDKKISLIYGDATKIELPERVDVCVSELIGTSGSGEGAISIINNIRRFLKDSSAIIPSRCVTNIAAVSLPDKLIANPSFSEAADYYTRKVFDRFGQEFDLRVCIRNLPRSHMISNIEIFEDLDFTEHISPEYQQNISFTIANNTQLHGFLLWINLFTSADNMLDVLECPNSSFAPLFFPTFYPGIEVSKGDIIQATCISSLADNQINQDYWIKGKLIRKSSEVIDFEFESLYHHSAFKATPFYKDIFSQERKELDLSLSTESLRNHLRQNLTDYMLPADYVICERLPLTVNGKVDYEELARSSGTESHLKNDFVAPGSALERKVAKIWREILCMEQIGIYDNFFELGGHSLLATRLISRIQNIFHVELPIRTLFETPTIAGLTVAILQLQAEHLENETMAEILAEIENL